MNRRHFAKTAIGFGAALIAGESLLTSSAFATASSRPTPTPSSDGGEDLTSHILSSRRRVYEHRRSGDFIVAIVTELDRRRNARTEYDRLLDLGLSTFEGVVAEDDSPYGGDLVDRGHRYTGVIAAGDGSAETRVAVLYAQVGTVVYAIAAGSQEDVLVLIDTYGETLFAADRTETDLLLTQDEMPRGFDLTEDDDLMASAGRRGGRESLAFGHGRIFRLPRRALVNRR